MRLSPDKGSGEGLETVPGFVTRRMEEISMKIVDRKLLEQLSTQARENPRLRKNWNIHPSDDFCCHRLLNAIEPGPGMVNSLEPSGMRSRSPGGTDTTSAPERPAIRREG